jgi:hypothetical protein
MSKASPTVLSLLRAPPEAHNSAMLGLFTFLFGRSDLKPLVVEGYWCDSTIRLPRKIKTPSGGSVTVVTVCVDVRYIIREGIISVLGVRLGRGGPIMGSSLVVNVSGVRGEAFYTPSIRDESLLVDAVQRDLALSGSSLRRIMVGKWRAERGGSLVRSLADALNDHATASQIANLLAVAGQGSDVTFLYTKPDGSSRPRKVSIVGVSGNSLRARDQADGIVKSFRLDRISEARSL